jgi:LmbE family N-acetylglucosaminyl deacetylase
MNALVIGAHLDDSVIALGGAIRKIVDAGGMVDVVCFGNSDEDFADISDRDTAVERVTAQAREAHEVLGVRSFTCFNYPDYDVTANRATYRLCIESIRKHKPDVIFAHYWAEYFQHHAMARLSCDAWWQAGWTCSADLGPPWVARALYHFEVIHALPEPSDIVDISDTFEIKMKAWNCFQPSARVSEDAKPRMYGSTFGGSLGEQLETRARYYGSLINVRYAEALKRSSYLPRAIREVAALDN